MFGMSHDAYLLLDALVTIIGLIVLITRFKVHPFIALIIAAGFLGLTSGMPVEKIVKSFQDGFGGVLGFVGVILALGTMLGKLMADSGGADQIARTLIRAFGKERVHWSMMLAAFLVGIPLFFEIGFILLIPLVFIVARRSGVSLIKIGIPLLAGLSAVHGLVPPHPGPLLAIGVFGADIGKTILYGLIVALPTAAIAGPLFGALVSRYIPGTPSAELVEQIAHEPETQDLPSFGVTLATVLLPVFLMLLKTFADVAFPDGHAFRAWMDMIGHPISALLLALLVALYTFGYARGFDSKKILRLLDQSLAPTAAIVMIIATGAGSLILSHVNDAGFWLVKQYFNMSVSETFKTWTAMETILSVVGLVFILLLSLVL
ncbi:gluconate:H+ symporter [Pseudomonas aeruginosa]|uniref:GntT/GntP/DsdX family permease n=1 Tax=Pseudomonas aeruginosa TaxID=287 RepID=UPI000F85F78C|nr:gluconate:H+ symporter [Pseudomonas aeruginosa]RUA94614.1 permease DsdX [Pseudomonas aeruginosa]